jgi:hypothetical protein
MSRPCAGSCKRCSQHGTICEALGDAGVEVTSASVVPASTDADAELAQLWAIAHQHGEDSEPDHEVGDLQELSRLCWGLLTAEQRRIVAAQFAPDTGDERPAFAGDFGDLNRPSPEPLGSTHAPSNRERSKLEQE